MKVEISKASLREMRDVARQLDDAGKTIAVAQYRAINAVASKTMTRSRRIIQSQVNLKAAHVRERMTLWRANRESQTAIINVWARPTRLTNYDARQVTRAARAARGDRLRGIPAGRKQAGISVAVKKGNRKRMPGAFFIPLRAGKIDGGNGMGVFIREGSPTEAAARAMGVRVGKYRWTGGIRHLYGPSVSQVFDRVADEIRPDVEADLETALVRQIRYEVDKAMSR